MFSADTSIVEPALPVASALPTIAGSTQSGSTLSVTSTGTWGGSPAFTYGWLRCGSDGGECSTIGGETGSSYTLTGSDVGATIRATVIGTNDGGSNLASSAGVGGRHRIRRRRGRRGRRVDSGLGGRRELGRRRWLSAARRRSRLQ